MEGHILLVEDDTNMRELLALFLEESGYRVTQAPDGETAVNLLTCSASQCPSYDVVCTDIIMGTVDGIEVMHAARCLPSPPEVILLTGHASLETAIAAVRAGAFDYLQKPCRPGRLLERVEAALRQRAAQLQHNEDGSAEPYPHASATPRISLPEEGNPEESTHSPFPPDRYLQVGNLRIDTYRHDVWFNEEPLYFTPTEYKILVYLAARAGRVASFSEIISYARGYSVDEEDARGLLRWHIRNLRQRFDRRYLVSVRGVGFMLVDPEEE